jgi:hypothetical protein
LNLLVRIARVEFHEPYQQINVINNLPTEEATALREAPKGTPEGLGSNLPFDSSIISQCVGDTEL